MAMAPTAPTSSKTAIFLATASSAAVLIFLYSKVKQRSNSYHKTEKNNDDNQESVGRRGVKAGVSARFSDLNGGNHSFKQSDDVFMPPLPPHLQREEFKERRRLAKVKHLAMKSPMYDNVKMKDQSGELLCNISTKKARWYVQKGLADWIDPDDERCIKLNFEPKNRSNRSEAGLYAKSDKRNICVSCGNDEYHMRHYVVPYAYRTQLPDKFKSHLSHDIVILCPTCHVDCERQCQRRMKEMEDSHRRPGSPSQFTVDRELYQVRSSALALLRWKHKIPPSKLLDYEHIVRTYLDLADEESCKVQLTSEQLQEAIDVPYRVENPDFVPGPDLVVLGLNGDETKIERFIRGWRRHFLDTVRPRFLPVGWSVDSPVVCGSD